MNQNLKKYINMYSNELDIIVNDEKKDSKYKGKKELLLKCAYRILGMLDNRKSFLPKYETFMSSYKNKLSKISLGLSLKQLDMRIMSNSKYIKNINKAHKANIIDNIVFLTPMNLLISGISYEKILESIAYSNTINSSNHKSELLTAMFEKYDKKKLPVSVQKSLKAYMHAYNIIRDNIIQSYI